MKELMRKMDGLLIRAKLEANAVLSEERGDTNFISIAIILVIMIGVAVAFIGIKDQVMNVVTKKTSSFLNSLK